MNPVIEQNNVDKKNLDQCMLEKYKLSLGY